MASGPAALTAIVVDFPRRDRCITDAWECVEEAAMLASQRTDKPIALLTSLSESLPEDICGRLMRAGVLPLHGLDAALDALAVIYGTRVEADPDRPIPIPSVQDTLCVRDEALAKAILERCGLNVPRHALAASPEEAGQVAESLLPVALKARGMAHKTEVGGVRLGLDSVEAVIGAANAMQSSSYYIEEMIPDGGVELLLGIIADPAHGYVLTLGAGGVLTELWQDTCHLLVPATALEIDLALDTLRIAPLLDGYRGTPRCQRATVIAAVLKVQDYVVAQAGRVAEIEINPLIVTPTRAVVADALIREEP
jgi:acyl-CoA synthetase (NDP forming)